MRVFWLFRSPSVTTRKKKNEIGDCFHNNNKISFRLTSLICISVKLFCFFHFTRINSFFISLFFTLISFLFFLSSSFQFVFSILFFFLFYFFSLSFWIHLFLQLLCHASSFLFLVCFSSLFFFSSLICTQNILDFQQFFKRDHFS